MFPIVKRFILKHVGSIWIPKVMPRRSCCRLQLLFFKNIIIIIGQFTREQKTVYKFHGFGSHAVF